MHRDRKVEELLEGYYLHGVELLPYSSFSPELDPTENGWILLKENINEKHTPPKGLSKNQSAKDKLIRAAIDINAGGLSRRGSLGKPRYEDNEAFTGGDRYKQVLH